MQEVKLYRHVTDGGAVYLLDSTTGFANATIIIRLDGGAELVKCDIEA